MGALGCGISPTTKCSPFARGVPRETKGPSPPPYPTPFLMSRSGRCSTVVVEDDGSRDGLRWLVCTVAVAVVGEVIVGLVGDVESD